MSQRALGVTKELLLFVTKRLVVNFVPCEGKVETLWGALIGNPHRTAVSLLLSYTVVALALHEQADVAAHDVAVGDAALDGQRRIEPTQQRVAVPPDSVRQEPGRPPA